MTPTRFLFAAVLLLAPAAAAPGAELRLATLFSDHIVLQRDKPVPVWGWADPGESVTVEFGDQRVTALADADGKWQAHLAAQPARAVGRRLTVRGADASRQVEVQDVLVGEVWLGSGQSNMAMSVSRALEVAREQEAADLPQVRMFRETSSAAAMPQAEGAGVWTVCSPETVAGFSATLYFFGRELHRELGVPVGLINSSVGGTPIEAWIDQEAQLETSELRESVEAALRQWAAFDPVKAREAYEAALAGYPARVEKAKAAGQPVPRGPQDPVAVRKLKGGPGGLFNAKIAPLVPYAIRGAVWYQGEGNAHPGKSPLYRHQLPLLVTDWRARWGEEFPFAWVQLPNFDRPGDGWPEVRQAMLETLRLPATGMAITIDVGDPQDIHPANKQEVGRRLALWALGEVYGREVVATSGPLPDGHEVRGDGIVLSFRHAEGGLQPGGGELKGFAVAGDDRQWHPASARIAGNQVIVSSPSVPAPVAVRYAWEANPDGNLRNAAGLPASPFRTDDWPLGGAAEEARP